MNPRIARFAILLLLAAFFRDLARAQSQPSPTTAPTRESAATLVVFNNLDPTSVTLAAYYATRRGIPLEHMVGLNCVNTEEITRAQYDETIAGPLRKIFAERGWWHGPADESQPITDNQIRFIALIRGIPLKIAEAPDYPDPAAAPRQKELNVNAAAVDSELAMLGVRTHHITGPAKNVYYRSFTPFMDTPFAPIMLVCRLDGPTEATVRNMIDGALSAEKTGLNGFACFDLRGITTGPLAIGDQWLATAAVTIRQSGMPLIWDNSPDLFPADYPMDHIAFYMGWYGGGVEGPMARTDFSFIPGAIAVHIHSFSAATLRSSQMNWAGPLLAHGAAATLGNVYEPYLALTTNLDLFADRLRNGLTFAESAYAAQPALSWMATFVGDPLYRPFHEIDEPPLGSTEKPAAEYAAYKRGAQLWYEKGRPAGEKQLAASAAQLQSGIIWEGLGLLQWSVPDNDAALISFRNAEKCYGLSEDAMRTALHQVEILKSSNKMPQARALAAKSLERYKDFHGTSLLRAVIGLPTPSPHAP